MLPVVIMMPFGRTYAPAVFQTSVNDVLHDMSKCFAFGYLDDILMFPLMKLLIQHVRQVLQRLMVVKTEKCEFHVSHFWGSLCLKGGR